MFGVLQLRDLDRDIIVWHIFCVHPVGNGWSRDHIITVDSFHEAATLLNYLNGGQWTNLVKSIIEDVDSTDERREPT